MELQITARHFDLIDPIKDFAEEKVKILHRYFNHITNAHLILTPVKQGYQAELTVSGKQAYLFAKANGDSLNIAIESVTSKIERQLKEKKERLRKVNKHSKKRQMPPGM